MSKTSDALQHIKVAGYHDNHSVATRLYIENRISRARFDKAWQSGVAARVNGVACNCPRCNEPAKELLERG